MSPKKGDPNIDPKNTTALILGTSKKVSLILGNSYVLFSNHFWVVGQMAMHSFKPFASGLNPESFRGRRNSRHAWVSHSLEV